MDAAAPALRHSRVSTTPRVLIGSSVEGLVLAQGVFANIERHCEPTLWTHGVFKPSETPVESLAKLLDEVDYGVLLLTPDDVRESRGTTSLVPRDNLVFEAGLMAGMLGMRNVFLLCPRGQHYSLPTDLLGVNVLEYVTRSDKNYRAGTATASDAIVDSLKAAKTAQSHRISLFDDVPARHRAGNDLRSLVNNCQSVFLLTGISLNYCVLFARTEIALALERGVTVIQLRANHELIVKGVYEPYKPQSLEEYELASRRWPSFVSSLTEEQQSRILVADASAMLLHSTGIYDAMLFQNPFCMGATASELPSFGISVSWAASRRLIRDVRLQLSSAEPLCGGLSVSDALEALALTE